ncbi:MAG: DUF3180 domain-containing protein [Brevibacterium sp.]|uniref:DUF3180 domain-containing protein n=1 Tax=Brevibacterium sandarakinum TaxID=629680 RepID=UPI00264FC87B|nr:DUF3180 domain-containing protein [Brevibacterium sandarakinum]MDN5585123.1 DUF3180 domain-containing protein [Brevibacterium sp.]MDN5634069.1 DUF3180 domain-containing protein [Brevibacterium sp.]MDN5656790.1 DUF3180 domain-containing protein [Brevibacterium sandarakinum]
MQRTSSGTLVIWAVIGVVLAPVVDVLLESQGFSLPGLPWFAIIGMLILAAVLLVLGWPIKKWNDGDRTKEIDPLQAARVAVMAKASALTGAGLTGWYLGNAAYYFLSAPGIRNDLAAGMLFAMIAAAALMIVGLIVEGFCALPPQDPPGAEAA